MVSNILNLLFNIYHGSEGKLSISEQKINILQVKLKHLYYIHAAQLVIKTTELFSYFYLSNISMCNFSGNRKFQFQLCN